MNKTAIAAAGLCVLMGAFPARAQQNAPLPELPPAAALGPEGERIHNALKEAAEKQKELSRETVRLEAATEADSGLNKEWTPQQQEEYLKALWKLQKQQQELEDSARREVERAQKGEDVTQ